MTTRKSSSPKSAQGSFTVPGLSLDEGHNVGALLQDRLHALNDLALTLKHAHWNVIGPDFIGVHEMLDPQIDAVRLMVDDTAERMATLGVPPVGTPGALVAARSWDDYSIGRASTIEHLAALDLVYDGIIQDQRDAISKVGDIDPLTEDLLIGHTRDLEQFQWFMRAHLERSDGSLSTDGTKTEVDAAEKSAKVTGAAAK
ncbi:MAG: starvation/stationary phase protection protein [Pseudonocardiales bacterium]|nr:starvation/stationary phase protection protein [Pseudonocardiales bacterium]